MLGHKSKYILVLFFLAAFLLFTPCTHASGEESSLRSYCGDYPPWMYTDGKGECIGIDIDLIKILGERMGLEVEITPSKFSHALMRLQVGDLDIAGSFFRRPEREKFLHYLVPAYQDHASHVFYVLRGMEHSIRSYADLKGKRIAVHRGSHYFPEFDNDESVTKVETITFQSAIHMLLAHEVDAVIYDESVGDYKLFKGDISDFVVKSDFVHSMPQNTYFGLSKKSKFADRLNEFQQIVKEMVTDGTVHKIITNHKQNLNASLQIAAPAKNTN